MAELNTDVRYIKGIGEKKALALNKLGVFSLFDLISHFPRRYEDRSQFKPIAMTLSEETRPIRGGFIMVDGDVEVNCAFETLVRMQRERMERDVAAILFD